MADLTPIPDEIYAEAGDVIRHVASGGTPPLREVMPGFDVMVAGVAEGLATGEPHAFWRSRESTAADYLQEGSEEWRHFHQAVARVIDIHRREPDQFETPGDAMAHMASDVMFQAEARAIHAAAVNTDPAFQEGLSPGLVDTAVYLREEPDDLALMKRRSGGFYEDLDPSSRADMANSMVNGELVSRATRDAMARAENLIESEAVHFGARRVAVENAVGDHDDFGTPLFADVMPAHTARARDLMQGLARPSGWSEIGIVAHAAVTERRDPVLVNVDEETRLLAYAREVARGATFDANGSGANVARRIEADLRLVDESGRQEAIADVAGEPLDRNSVPSLIARGEYRSLPTDSMVMRYDMIERGEEVPALATLRLGRAAMEVGRDELLVGKARERAERRITYEGVDASDQNDRWVADLYLPGDRVRFAPDNRIAGVDHEELGARAGSGPLTVARTIVEGVQRDNAMGGTYEAALLHYEFRETEGRFPAQAFQHERGDVHEYGVLMMDRDKLWFVPMSSDAGSDGVAIGSAREVTSSVEGPNVGSLDVMKDMVKDEPAAGEFVVRPDAFGSLEGPVELAGVPWMSSASSGEIAAAKGALVGESGRRAAAMAMVAGAGQGR